MTAFDIDAITYGCEERLPPISEIREYGAECTQCGPVMFLYRAVATCHHFEWRAADVEVMFTRFRVVKFTPKGAWVTEFPDWYDKPILKWVTLDRFEGKRLAYIDKEKAIRSLKRRNRRHIQILMSNLASAKAVSEFLNEKEPK